MDFAQKIIEKRREVQTLCHKERKTNNGEEDDDTRAPDLPVPGPKDPEEEW